MPRAIPKCQSCRLPMKYKKPLFIAGGATMLLPGFWLCQHGCKGCWGCGRLMRADQECGCWYCPTCEMVNPVDMPCCRCGKDP